jgi:hypothetical protein
MRRQHAFRESNKQLETALAPLKKETFFSS